MHQIFTHIVMFVTMQSYYKKVVRQADSSSGLMFVTMQSYYKKVKCGKI